MCVTGGIVMNSSGFVLLKTLLRSTSQINIFRHCKDKKKKGRIIGSFIGLMIAYLALMTYCVLIGVGFASRGMADVIPGISALTISVLALFFTFFKTNGYLFNFKEYDMLMAFPFSPSTVAGCKFLYMYIKSLLWNMSISVAMLIGYAVNVKPAVWVYPVWLILSLFLPVIPMLIAAFIGFLIAKIGSGFRKKNIIQTVLSFLVVIFFFALRFIIDDFARDSEKLDEVLGGVFVSVKNAENIYLPAEWFDRAVHGFSVSDILLLTGSTILLFVLIFIPVGRSYRSINSKLKSHVASGKYRMTELKKRSILNAIAFKEFRRMTGSTLYLTNAAMGEVLALIAGIAVLFFDFDSIISTIMQGAPVSKEMLYPAFPLVIYFFIGMVATTVTSPSLEGKNYWIVQSLPITKKTLRQGKMLFNMYLSVPFGVFTTVCVCISAKVPILTAVLSVILIVCLCAFSTTWGCVCGIRHMRLDWENEIEVVKQGANVSVYLFPNMFATMALIVLVVFLGLKMNVNLILGLLILIVSALAVLSYKRAVSLK